MNKVILITSILAVLAGPALAQPDPHHPDQSPTQGTTGQGMTPGQNMMSGQGMMGPGMMGQGMMMNCPMMGSGMMGSGNPHTEGRLAFLKTELKITESQEKAWNRFSDVMREVDQKRASASTKMGQGGMAPGMMGQGTMGQGTMGQGMMSQSTGLSAPDALKKRVDLVETHLGNLKKLQAATAKLYRDLDESQKKTADELLGMPCGMGAM